MRILWISFLGSWTEPLLKQLVLSPGLKLGFLLPAKDKGKNEFEVSNVDMFYVDLKLKSLYENMSLDMASKFKEVIDQFKPDLIHVHGTEKNWAQIQNHVPSIPIVISIQGIMMGYRRFGLNFLEKGDYQKYNSLKNVFGYGGATSMKKLFMKSYSYEADIFKEGKYFIGRTDWDKAHVLFRNPGAEYFYGEELLRSPFYEKANTWKLHKCDSHTVFMPSGFTPIKGLHWALEAIALVKKFCPRVKLVVPGIPSQFIAQSKFKRALVGESFTTFIFDKIKKLGIEENVLFLPNLNAEQMAGQMQKANVFLSPSSIDNSPNAIGEAMMIGVPVVTTPVGGITSFMQDNETCLFAGSGDPYLMAFQIKRIFDDAELANGLSKRAHIVALKRHSVNETRQQYIEIYKTVISSHATKLVLK